jgi:hypothetical protein
MTLALNALASWAARPRARHADSVSSNPTTIRSNSGFVSNVSGSIAASSRRV